MELLFGLIGIFAGLGMYTIFRVLISGFYIVRPDQRAVLTSFGRAQRMPEDANSKADSPHLTADEQQRYQLSLIHI